MNEARKACWAFPIVNKAHRSDSQPTAILALWGNLDKASRVIVHAEADTSIIIGIHGLLHAMQGPVEVVKKGTIRNIHITQEDRQGGRKHLTRVSYVESFGFDADELAGIMQRKFQTSSSVQKLPGKNETGKEIALQGPLLYEVPKFLTATYGLSAEHIDVKSKGK